MKNNRNKLQKTIITIFISLLIIQVLIMCSISYYRSSQELAEQNSFFTRQIAQNINNQIDQLLYQHDELSLRLANAPQVSDYVESKSEDYYGHYLFVDWLHKYQLKEMILAKTYIESFHIISDNGFAYNSDAKNNIISQNLLEQHDPSTNNSTIFTLLIKDPVFTNHPAKSMLILRRRIYLNNSQQTAGSLYLAIDMEVFEKIWNTLNLKNSYIWVINQDGQVVYHPDKTLIGTVVESKEQFKNNNGFLNEQEYRHCYETSSYSGLKIVLSTQKQYYSRPVNRIRQTILITGITSLLFAIVLIVFLVMLFKKPASILRDKMTEVSNGNFSMIEMTPPANEIGDLIITYNTMVTEIEKLIKNVENEKSIRRMAEIEALQMQINPHFLYNTLGAINNYTLANKPEKVQTIVTSLSDMFRYAVQDPLKPVRAEHEINHVKDYLAIQECRLERMPEVIWEIESISCEILRLTLQPLIENVFQHAFPDGINKNHKIWIIIKAEDDFTYITVKDNGVGYNLNRKDSVKNTGIGLSNVSKRLMLYYGPDSKLEISDNGNGTTVVMKIPTIRE